MSSERRIIASRINGAGSRSPVNKEGKLASRNDLRHGFLSETIVFEDESSETVAESWRIKCFFPNETG
jgi:hypothetical protein